MDRTAYVLTFTAILLWSGAASAVSLLTSSDPARQFVVVGIGLLVGGLMSAHRWREWKVPRRTLLVGVGGMFGYHLLYYTAFAFAPAVELSLVQYVWPLLIVLLAPVIIGGTISAQHVLGGALGMAGCMVIAFGGLQLSLEHAIGYCMAALAALVWAVYSLLTKRLPPFPTAAVGGFCVLSGIGALVVVALWSGNLWAMLATFTRVQWLVLLALGLGPLGAAFFCWDAALKRGDPRIIGTLAYLTPLLSTCWLLLLRRERPGWPLLLALVLIIGGAAIGSRGARAKPD